MKETFRIYENHIYCDNCEKDIVNTIGHGYLKMKEMEKEAKKHGWLIKRNKQYCNVCREGRG